jgi:hypothetical protein
MRLALIIPDAVGIRNFILGPFLKGWDGEIVILHEYPATVVKDRCNGFSARAQFQPLLPFRERPVPFGLRQSLDYAQMFWADTSAMRYNRKRRVGGSWRTKSVNRAARLVGRAAASGTAIRGLESVYFHLLDRFPEVDDYRRQFERQRPSVVFSSSQRSLSAILPVLAARSLGIPTATFIISWDNLTSKGRIAAPFDHYLVWSDHMRRELLRYHPGAADNHIHIVGTPQFDFYADDSLRWTREEFFHRVGADPARPLICYSGGDQSIAPQDQEHVRLLMGILRSGRIAKNPQVLLRPCPVDEGSRFDAVRRDFPELLYEHPRWETLEPGNWSRCVPYPDDVRFLANLTRHADLNINVASTMTLDFGLHDKPVINIAFDVGATPPARLPMWDYYGWEHYRPVVELGAVRCARSPEQLAEHINLYLDNPAADRDGRRKLAGLQVGVPLGQSSRRICEVLASLAQPVPPNAVQPK